MYEELKKASIDFCSKNEFLVDKDGMSHDLESAVALYAFQAGARWMREYLEKHKDNEL